MRKCDFCKNDTKCSGVQRSECIIRDFFRFEMERSAVDEREAVITRLLIEAGGVFNPRAVARHLVKNGVCIKD